MIHDAEIVLFRAAPDQEVLLVRVSAGEAPTRAIANRIINAVRATVPVSQLALDVVVLDGDQGPVFGSSATVEDLCRYNTSRIRVLHGWIPRKLEW